ncbi:MAG: DUF2059 domain-containing protein [Jannaschia sp.]
MSIFSRFSLLVFVGLTLPSGQGRAEQPVSPGSVEVSRLLEVTRIEPLVEIVATEGLVHGLELEGALFPGRGGRAWQAEVSRIQTPVRMLPIIRAALNEMLRPSESDAAIAFFSSDLGRRIVDREVAARRAMLDTQTESQAREASATLTAATTPRALLIDELIGALDLVDVNVSSGMNANFAFYRGLASGGNRTSAFNEGETLATVRAQESEIRTQTVSWLRAFMMLAYAGLTDEDLQAYIRFSTSDVGRRYNAAMFQGFGTLFETTSYDLGRAAARFMVQSDI